MGQFHQLRGKGKGQSRGRGQGRQRIRGQIVYRGMRGRGNIWARGRIFGQQTQGRRQMSSRNNDRVFVINRNPRVPPSSSLPSEYCEFCGSGFTKGHDWTCCPVCQRAFRADGYCRKCKAPVLVDAKFCKCCGSKISGHDDENENDDNGSSSSSNNGNNGNGKGNAGGSTGNGMEIVAS